MTKILAMALAGLALLNASAMAATLEVGDGKAYKLPSAAIAAAHDGDHVLIQPGEYFDCASVAANRVVIEGVGPAEKVVLTDKACAGKALLIIDGTGDIVRNLTLTRARVADGNGAGIRDEGHDLVVEKVRFVNNQNGILTTDDAGTLIVRDSLFERNGACENACAHGLYAGHLTLLHVENSRFIDTQHTHHIKSRALRTEVIGCTIDDGPNGTASYEVEVPNGGALVVRDSNITKGPKAENTAASIMIGSEGVTQRTPEITIENNQFHNAGNYNTVFVKNLTATEANLRGNRISGAVKPLSGDGSVNGS